MKSGFNKMKNVIKELGLSVQQEWSQAELKKETAMALPLLRTAYLSYMDNTADANYGSFWHLYEFKHGPKSGSPERLFATRLVDNRFVIYFKEAQRPTPLTSGTPAEIYQKGYQPGGHVWRTKAWTLERGSSVHIARLNSEVLAPKHNPKNPNMSWFFKKDVDVSFASMSTVGSFQAATVSFHQTFTRKYINGALEENNKNKRVNVSRNIRRAYKRK